MTQRRAQTGRTSAHGLASGFTPAVYFEWLQECTLCGPPIIDTLVKEVSGNSQNVSPLRDGQRLPVIRKGNITPLVVHLFRASSPSAIIWRIRTIVVYAVQGVPFWTLPHVLKEVSKRFAPTVADGNTSPAIIGVGLVLRTVATSKHRNVRPVQRMVRKSVLPCGGDTVLETKTTAAFGVSTSQAAPIDLAMIAAIAKTVPDSKTEFVYVGKRKDSQSPKSLTGQVLNAGRCLCGIMGLHREPPVFSLLGAGAFRASPALLIPVSIIIAQNAFFRLFAFEMGI